MTVVGTVITYESGDLALSWVCCVVMGKSLSFSETYFPPLRAKGLE